MRVFWPKNCLAEIPDPSTCLFVGWNNEEGDVVIVTALPYLDPGLVSQLLDRDALLGGVFSPGNFDRSMIFSRNFWLGAEAKPSHAVVAAAAAATTVNGATAAASSDTIESINRSASQLYSKLNQKRVSVVGLSNAVENSAFGNKKLLRISSDTLCAPITPTITDANGDKCLVVVFDAPDPRRMHYFSLERANLFELRNDDSLDFSDLRDELKYHSRSLPKTDMWELIAAQLNCVHDLQQILRRNSARIFPELRDDPTKIKNFTFEPPKQTQKRTKHKRRRSLAHPRVQATHIVLTFRSVIGVFLQFLERARFRGMGLTSIFCTAQQIDLRLNQLCYLPHEYIAITRRSQQDWHWLTPDRNEAYIRFNNYLWLGINDFIFGFYLYSVIFAYSEEIATGVDSLIDILSNEFINITHWLMSWPAGFKLNTRLAYFMGEITIWVILAWRKCLSTVLTPNTLRYTIKAIAISGVLGGATLQISMVIDFFSILSFHLHILYQMLARVYSQQQRVLHSLFRVFRGRKYNTLRKRVDYGNYDVNQLLLGTILFTVVLFLLPTVFAFYAVFTLAKMTALFIVGGLCICLAFLNHFPLFPLLLRLKSPRRVPSGIVFRLPQDGTHLELYSKSMELSEIFGQYLNTMRLFVNDLFTFNTVKELATGEVVNIQQSKLYASLYSMLPGKRQSVESLAAELSSYLDIKQNVWKS